MLPFLLTYFALTYLLTLLLGYLQTPNCLPDAQSEVRSELYSTLAVTAVSVQAFVSIMLLRGTAWFPAAAVFLAFTLLCHHAVIHRHSRFEGETCSCAPFQCKDISNHETWVVAGLVAGLVSLLHL